MLTFTTGDILKADVEALVNTVNCVGVMGRGIALQFKSAFPDNFKVYEAACKRHEVQPGRMLVVETGRLTNPKFIINFPTKRHWRGQSRMEDITAGLQALVEEVRRRKIRSIAVPPLGAGLGGLDWLEVKAQVIAALEPLHDVAVQIFEPRAGDDQSTTAKSSRVPNMTPGRAALVLLMDNYLRGLLDPFVTLLEVHKLMYFMQEAKEPLKLHYAKAPYGPYAENLRHVLRAIEGHLVTGYLDGGDNPEKELQIVPGATADARQLLAEGSATDGRFRRVVELVRGWESPFGMELLATVHWVVTREGATSPNAAAERIYAWSARKRRFSPEQIELAFHTLQSKGWFADEPPAAPAA